MSTFQRFLSERFQGIRAPGGARMALPSRVQAPSALPAAEDAQAWPLISAPPAPPDSILDLSPSAMATARSAEVVVEGDSTLTFDYEQNWIAKPAPRPSGRFCDYCQAPTRAPPARPTARPPACTHAHAHTRTNARPHATLRASERARVHAGGRAGGRASEWACTYIHLRVQAHIHPGLLALVVALAGVQRARSHPCRRLGLVLACLCSLAFRMQVWIHEHGYAHTCPPPPRSVAALVSVSPETGGAPPREQGQEQKGRKAPPEVFGESSGRQQLMTELSKLRMQLQESGITGRGPEMAHATQLHGREGPATPPPLPGPATPPMTARQLSTYGDMEFPGRVEMDLSPPPRTSESVSSHPRASIDAELTGKVRCKRKKTPLSRRSLRRYPYLGLRLCPSCAALA